MKTKNQEPREIDVMSLFAALKRDGHAKLSDHVKKAAGIILLLLCLSIPVLGQSKYTRQGDTYVMAPKQQQQATPAKRTGKKVQTPDGKKYDIYLSKNGRAYIERTSRNGNTYKQYLGEEVSREICRELGVAYKEKTR